MTLTQTDFEKLIENLHNEQTEPPYLDCKEELPLDEPGDKASFIRDIAALANNVCESYLIIGIQDKTWKRIGIPPGVLLLDPDQTQNRMNQILEIKLDPQLSIRYQVFELDNQSFGIVSVSGRDAPYVIAINDIFYGGNKTKGQPCNIYRGAIYIRHGGSTVIANRQSQILNILNQKYTSDTVLTTNNKLDEFLARNSYTDTESTEFGQNQLSQGLVEKRWIDSDQRNEIAKADSWVSIAFVPVQSERLLDPSALLAKLQPENRIGRDGSWYHGLPTPVMDILRTAKATPKGISGKWHRNLGDDPGQYHQALTIQPDGIIHFVSSYPLFYQNQNIRFYGFVALIGYLWQLIFLAKAIYAEMKFKSPIIIIINLIGAKNTYLADLAQGPQKKWKSVFDWDYYGDLRDINQENNIQVQREILLVEARDAQIEMLIREIAKEIGQYYNHQQPKCFTPDTNEFPVKQYYRNNNW